MQRLIPYAIILVLIGVVIGLNVQPTPLISSVISPEEMATSANNPLNETSQQNSQQLHNQLNQLQKRIDGLEMSLNEAQTKNTSMLTQLSISQQTLAQSLKQIKKNQATSSDTDESTLSQINDGLKIPDITAPKLTEAQRNKKILLTMGVEDNDASRIQRLAEKKEMDQLYLRNTAAREGWFGTEKYFEKTRELDLSSNIYREELGDDKYDQFLYSSQLPNRITIQSVLSGSPAENSGLQSGDFIISYDDQRVFNWSDLTSLTANGEAGENISIEIKRNGQVFQYFIARGPLGIRLSSERVSPDPS